MIIFLKNAYGDASDLAITKNLSHLHVMDGEVINGENDVGGPGPSSQHVALNMLSDVLDETIFNLEEGNRPEAFLPLTIDSSLRYGYTVCVYNHIVFIQWYI